MHEATGTRSTGSARLVFTVAARGLLSGRRWVVVAALDALFLLVAVIIAAAGARSRDEQYMVDLYRNLVVPILMPFICLLFATEAFGGEIEDRTLIYLTLRPVPSRAIVLPKYLAACAISLTAVWLAVVPGYLVLVHGDGGARMLLGLLASSLLGVAAYCGVYMALGLLVRRSLLIGVIYMLFWEGAVSGISQTAAHLSLRYYAIGTFSGILRRPDLVSPDSAGSDAGRAVIVLPIVVIAAVALTVRQLRRVELP